MMVTFAIFLLWTVIFSPIGLLNIVVVSNVPLADV
jgi:hypothetical protein